MCLVCPHIMHAISWVRRTSSTSCEVSIEFVMRGDNVVPPWQGALSPKDRAPHDNLALAFDSRTCCTCCCTIVDRCVNALALGGAPPLDRQGLITLTHVLRQRPEPGAARGLPLARTRWWYRGQDPSRCGLGGSSLAGANTQSTPPHTHHL